MADETTLTYMAECDFSAPITVSIQYDDSDDEDNDIESLLSDIEESTNSDKQNNLANKSPNLADKRKIKCEDKNEMSESKKSRNELKNGKLKDSNNLETTMKEYVSICENQNYTGGANSIEKGFHEVSSYIQNLLKTVSDHLILVIIAFQQHTRVVIENKDCINGNLRIQASKMRYSRFKTNIFQLSYSAVESVILTQETNNQFIEAFLNHTVKLAEEKRHMHLTKQYVEPFFHDLIYWTKQKRNDVNNYTTVELMKKSENNTPILSRQLLQPPITPQIRSIKAPNNKTKKSENVRNQNSKQPPSTVITGDNQVPYSIPIFRMGPPDQEIRIDVQPHLLNAQTQQMAQIARMVEHPSPPYAVNKKHYHIDQIHQYRTHYATNNFPPNSNVDVPSWNEIYNRNYQINNVANNDPNITWRNQNYNVTQQSQTLPTFTEFCAHPNAQQNICNSKDQFASSNQNQACHYESRCAPNLSPKKVFESGRSVSTDSGYVSPLQFNNSVDPMPAEQAQHRSQFAPLITHVTSLNPNATQISEGSCYVCGKPTKKKCMGCYSIYYCGYQCENTDWQRHIYFCKRGTDTQQPH